MNETTHDQRSPSEIKQAEVDRKAGISTNPEAPLDYVPPADETVPATSEEDSASDSGQIAGVGGNAPSPKTESLNEESADDGTEKQDPAQETL